jgi:predicted DNA-binding transcriptional regulator YafY
MRTVYRDLKALEEAGVPIGVEAGRGYFLVEGYHLPPVMFTHDEANAFLVAEKLLEKSTDSFLIKKYQSALRNSRCIKKRRNSWPKTLKNGFLLVHFLESKHQEALWSKYYRLSQKK